MRLGLFRQRTTKALLAGVVFVLLLCGALSHTHGGLNASAGTGASEACGACVIGHAPGELPSAPTLARPADPPTELVVLAPRPAPRLALELLALAPKTSPPRA